MERFSYPMLKNARSFLTQNEKLVCKPVWLELVKVIASDCNYYPEMFTIHVEGRNVVTQCCSHWSR